MYKSFALKRHKENGENWEFERGELMQDGYVLLRREPLKETPIVLLGVYD